MRKIDSSNKLSITKKWGPIVQNYISMSNANLLEYICMYCEWYSSDEDSLDLPTKLNEIKNKVESSIRVDIECKSFNPLTGNIEYKLSNGNYILTTGSVDILPTDGQLLDLFGIDFLRDLDPIIFRDKQLDKILK